MHWHEELEGQLARPQIDAAAIDTSLAQCSVGPTLERTHCPMGNEYPG